MAHVKKYIGTSAAQEEKQVHVPIILLVSSTDLACVRFLYAFWQHKRKAEAAQKAASRPPKKAKTTYATFQADPAVINSVKAANPTAQNSDVKKLLRAHWNSLDKAAQQPYEAAALADKARYQKEIADRAKAPLPAEDQDESQLATSSSDDTIRSIAAMLVLATQDSRIQKLEEYARGYKGLTGSGCIASAIALSPQSRGQKGNGIGQLRSYIHNSKHEAQASQALKDMIERENVLSDVLTEKDERLKSLVPYTKEAVEFLLVAPTDSTSILADSARLVAVAVAEKLEDQNELTTTWHCSVQNKFVTRRSDLLAKELKSFVAKPRFSATNAEQWKSEYGVPVLDLTESLQRCFDICVTESEADRALEVMRLIDSTPELSLVQKQPRIHHRLMYGRHQEWFENTSDDNSICKDLITFVGVGGKLVSGATNHDLNFIETSTGSAASDVKVLAPMMEREQQLMRLLDERNASEATRGYAIHSELARSFVCLPSGNVLVLGSAEELGGGDSQWLQQHIERLRKSTQIMFESNFMMKLITKNAEELQALAEGLDNQDHPHVVAIIKDILERRQAPHVVAIVDAAERMAQDEQIAVDRLWSTRCRNWWEASAENRAKGRAAIGHSSSFYGSYGSSPAFVKRFSDMGTIASLVSHISLGPLSIASHTAPVGTAWLQPFFATGADLIKADNITDQTKLICTEFDPAETQRLALQITGSNNWVDMMKAELDHSFKVFDKDKLFCHPESVDHFLERLLRSSQTEIEAIRGHHYTSRWEATVFRCCCSRLLSFLSKQSTLEVQSEDISATDGTCSDTGADITVQLDVQLQADFAELQLLADIENQTPQNYAQLMAKIDALEACLQEQPDDKYLSHLLKYTEEALTRMPATEDFILSLYGVLTSEKWTDVIDLEQPLADIETALVGDGLDNAGLPITLRSFILSCMKMSAAALKPTVDAAAINGMQTWQGVHINLPADPKERFRLVVWQACLNRRQHPSNSYMWTQNLSHAGV